jgi:hypothetical protein
MTRYSEKHRSKEHCSDEELLLEYYGEESGSTAAHLSSCAECTSRYRALRETLDVVTLEPPDRGDRYGLEVWQAIRHRLPAREAGWHSLLTPRWGLAAAAALLLAVGFTTGRMWPRVDPAAPSSTTNTAVSSASSAAADEEARLRVALLDMNDHFDRSDGVLAEVMNAAGPRDLSRERQRAVDLVAASRIYRQNAVAMNEPALAAVLEEVERVLLDIVHQPPQATAADLNEIRRRIDSAGLLFKVRVMTNELQHRLEQPSSTGARTPTPTIG